MSTTLRRPSLFASISLVSLLAFTGCDTAPPGYTYGGPHAPRPAYAFGAQPATGNAMQVDPHYGTEYRDAMEAIGQVARPFASPNAPINTQPDKSMNALRGYGTLLDLLNKK